MKRRRKGTIACVSDVYPRVALIMPFLNESAHLPDVLASIEAQTYPRESLALYAVDNGSTDGGGAMVRAWLERNGMRGQVLDVRPPSIPAALNRAIAAVDADAYVVRIDAHTRYAADYIARIMSAFADLPADAWCVGGNPTAVALPRFGSQLHAALFESPLGLGSAAYRRSGPVVPVASVYLGAWRPGVLQRLGGYDERWRANEDAELAERIRAAGGRVYRVPLELEKIITRGARGALRQWSRYGYWRGRTIVRHPKALRPRHLAPPLMVLGALGIASSPLRRWLATCAVVFAALVVAKRPRGQRAALTAATVVYFPAVHAGFGGGMLLGIADGVRRRLGRKS